MEITKNSFVFVAVTATAPSDNIFVNKTERGGQGVAHKQVQMGKDGPKLNFQTNDRKME